ncbi:MAG: GTPase Era [Bacteroidetes bacterium 4572_128]|nr:MAG: GTPase Era [Bacteroidetes bacterium 4572_128]
MLHKSGFVNIVGNPNVGKSTLMNIMVGDKISIITNKSQTTRHRIMGIVNEENYQIVYSDTPGVIKPNYKLQENMLNFSLSALSDADIILYVTDIYEKIDKNQDFLQKIQKLKVPILILINKIDLSNQEKINEQFEIWEKILPNSEIFPISALEKFNLENLFNRILELLPESPPYFDKDVFTDKSERFFVSEIIREKILLNYKKEIPYSVEIEIEEFKRQIKPKKILKIKAVIHVERETQKGIIIGNKGKSIKKFGTQARIDIEKFFGEKVFLEFFVKLNKNWKDKEFQIKNFGY